jgi:hypothetical protein
MIRAGGMSVGKPSSGRRRLMLNRLSGGKGIREQMVGR